MYRCWSCCLQIAASNCVDHFYQFASSFRRIIRSLLDVAIALMLANIKATCNCIMQITGLCALISSRAAVRSKSRSAKCFSFEICKSNQFHVCLFAIKQLSTRIAAFAFSVMAPSMNCPTPHVIYARKCEARIWFAPVHGCSPKRLQLPTTAAILQRLRKPLFACRE